MKLALNTCDVRSWRSSDVDSLVAHANNRQIWLNLRDRFPHPYTKRDGREFIREMRHRTPETGFAIAVEEQAVGGIEFRLHTDVERVSAEIGYWLGEPFWGRGIVTEALVAVTWYAIDTHNLTRLYALPFASNMASPAVYWRRPGMSSKAGSGVARSKTAGLSISSSTHSSLRFEE